MAWRWGPGPVFVYEWRLASRRWQLYAGRALFVTLVGAVLTLVWLTKVGPANLSIQQLAAVGESFFCALVGTQLALVLLAAPAYTAGAICQDKVRGPLLHLLATDLSDAEIVLGKLLARLLPVLGLVLATVPVLFAAILLGGIDPEAALGATLVTLGVAVLGCTLTLVLSVWGRKTYEVLLAAYLLIALLVLPGMMWAEMARQARRAPPPDWVVWSNPFELAFLPYLWPGTAALPAQALFLGITLAVSAVLVVVAVRRMRAVLLRQMSAPARRPWRRRRSVWSYLPGPSLDGNPILWREWRHRRPSAWARIVWAAYAILATFFSLSAMASVQSPVPPIFLPLFAAFVNGFQVCTGLLLLSVNSVTALAEERARGSIDLLLVTPLTGRAIAWGKWCGAFRRVPLLAVWPALVAGAAAPTDRWAAGAAVAGLVLAYGAAVTSLGLILAASVRHLGRAVALSVAVVVLVTAGWFFFVLATCRASYGRPAAALSPFYGVMFPILFPEEGVGWAIVWGAVYAVIAAALLSATLVGFERSLGRVKQRAARALSVHANTMPGTPTGT
jgi:ABC-type transport system involved in multi-copper enzyme maturation permease subunit